MSIGTFKHPLCGASDKRPDSDALDDKSLSKDWDTIQSIKDNPKNHMKNLVEASNLLRALADHLPDLLGPELWKEGSGDGTFRYDTGHTNDETKRRLIELIRKTSMKAQNRRTRARICSCW